MATSAVIRMGGAQKQEVFEYATITLFPLVGEVDAIYIAADTNSTYRWNTGTLTYVQIGGAGGGIEDWAGGGHVYNIGDYVLHESTIFKCILAHTSVNWAIDYNKWQITDGMARLTRWQRAAFTPPHNGVIVLDTTENQLYRFDNGGWREV
jgi:hypothetical protein